MRCAATGHSFSPISLTGGTLLRTDRMTGVTGIDSATGRVTALPGTPVAAFGPPLWDAGLALENQGDIDTQGIAGAVATATHGSGLGLQSFSATVRRMRLVTADGDVLEIGEDDPRLPAAQVALGMLGVITEVELQAVPAHRLAERIEHWTWDEAWGRLDEMARAHRHYSFFWIPAEGSAELYGLTAPEGATLADSCYVKIYDEAGGSVPDSAEPGRRVDRSYRIYPMTFEPNFHELEYFVPYDRGAEAVAAMRELMLARLPDSIFPMEVRTVAADESWLSHSTSARASSSRCRACRGRTTSRTCATSTGSWASSTRASTGEAPLPDRRAAPRPLPAGRRLRRAAPRARPTRRLSERPPA